MDVKVEELADRVRLTDGDFIKWCDGHKIKGCSTTRIMVDEGVEIRRVEKCEDCRAEAQLNKVLNDSDLCIRVCRPPESWDTGCFYIPAAEALKEVSHG